MKKVFKIVGIVLGVAVIGIAGAAAFIQINGIPKYTPKTIDLKVEVTPARIERGSRMASMLCNNCHMNPTTKQLTGIHMADAPEAFGVVYSKNITQDPEFGIGKWTDGELAYFLRTGVRPDGSYAPPYMIKLPKIADEDIYSIIAFLRSGNHAVQAAAVADREPEPSFLAKFLCYVAFKPSEYPTKKISAPDTTDKVAYGRYLVQDAFDCYGCHSSDFTKLDMNVPENSEGYLGGGNAMSTINKKVIYTTNLTPDKETGIGKWSEADFINTLRTGFRPDGTPLRYPMMRLFELSDFELSSMYAYLRTVPAINNPRKNSELFDQALNTSAGARIYHKYSCQSCHGEDGIGIGDLTKADIKYPTNEDLTKFLKNPAQYIGETKMLAWDGKIREDEYEALCNYVRELGRKAQNKNRIAAE